MKPDAPTFGEVAWQYVATDLAGADLSPGTRIAYRSGLRVLQRHWPGLADTPVAKIRQTDCKQWFVRRSRMVGVQQINLELSMLKAVLDMARLDGHLQANPADSLRPASFELRSLLVPTRKEFTDLVLMFSIMGNRDARKFVELLAYSGMTRAEAAALTWGDVDFDARTVRVSGPGGTRCVPLFPNLNRLLLAMRKELDVLNPGERVSRIAHCQHSLRVFCRLCSLPRYNYRSFRHFFAMEAVRNGIDCELIGAWLGYKDGGVQVSRLYWRFLPRPPNDMAALMTYMAGEELEKAITK